MLPLSRSLPKVPHPLGPPALRICSHISFWDGVPLCTAPGPPTPPFSSTPKPGPPRGPPVQDSLYPGDPFVPDGTRGPLPTDTFSWGCPPSPREGSPQNPGRPPHAPRLPETSCQPHPGSDRRSPSPGPGLAGRRVVSPCRGSAPGRTRPCPCPWPSGGASQG